MSNIIDKTIAAIERPLDDILLSEIGRFKLWKQSNGQFVVCRGVEVVFRDFDEELARDVMSAHLKGLA